MKTGGTSLKDLLKSNIANVMSDQESVLKHTNNLNNYDAILSHLEYKKYS